ncbi:hypothetical protein JZU68_07595, partial [bacterium]|nr:hypothetical protein [bacterium]
AAGTKALVKFVSAAGSRYNNHTSTFTSAEILAKVDANAPSTGLLVVEIFYNYNQISFTNRTFLSSYAEYYNDWNNVFYGNYLNAQALINYKLPKMVIIGIGYRFHNNFDVDVKQNFIQFKIEKSFSWK